MLSEKKCEPCLATTPPMKLEASNRLLQELNGWQLALDGRAIRKRFSFPDFITAMAFANRVGDVAEEQKHHPDLMVGWGYVECVCWTHTIAGLHENDFIVAAQIDQLAPK